MTSLVRRLASGVARSLPDVVAYKEMVILLPPQEYLVRGFLFERTITSDRSNVWELIVPLYNPVVLNPTAPTLNYSRRVSVGCQGYSIEVAAKEDLARVCAEVALVLQQKYVPELDAITTVDSWFRARPPEVGVGQRLNILLDYAVGYALCNEVQRTAELLEQILGRSDDAEHSVEMREYLNSIERIAAERLLDLQSGVSRVRQSIQPIVAENLRRQFPVLVGE